jgi:hypothetical protein
MELSIDHISVTPIKLFSNNNPPPMRRIWFRIEPEMHEEVLGIAHYESMDLSEAIRKLLSFSLTYYQKTKELAQSKGQTVPATIDDMAAFAMTFYEKTKDIAEAEGLDINAAADELVSYALRNYHYRKGTLNEVRNTALPDKHKMFHCQICQKETNVRRKHRISALNEEYVCCEDCFFADRHKTLISIMVNR